MPSFRSAYQAYHLSTKLKVHHVCREFTTKSAFSSTPTSTTSTTTSPRSSRQHHLRKRPIVHLSSAPGQKYKAKAIGTSHPVVPHEITSSVTIPDYLNIVHPSYAQTQTGGYTQQQQQQQQSSSATRGQQELALIHNHDDSMHDLRKATKLAAEMLQLASSIVTQYRTDGSSTDGQQAILTTNDIDIALHNAILQHNAYPSILNYHGFPKSICTSVNEVACRGIPDLRPLQYGDIVSLDVSVYLNGFHGDNCTTVMAGQDFHEENDGQSAISSNLIDDDDDNHDEIQRGKALINATSEAMYEAINVCRAGVEICQIGNTVQEVAHGHGYRPMKNVCGRGIGKWLHMLPEVKHYRNKDVQRLEPGMVITIEPVLVEGHHAHVTWADGWSRCTIDSGMAAQFKHMVLIQENGPPDILTIK